MHKCLQCFFQYAILATVILTVFLKYILHAIDLQSENPWENKAVFMLYVELITGLSAISYYICTIHRTSKYLGKFFQMLRRQSS